MKLSRHMRMNLNLVPDEGEGRFFYRSQAEPLAARGLITWEMREHQITIRSPFARLTPPAGKGRQTPERAGLMSCQPWLSWCPYCDGGEPGEITRQREEADEYAKIDAALRAFKPEDLEPLEG